MRSREDYIFTQNGKKKTYTVIPFGPKNTPAFYTAMMQALRDNWLTLFNETKHNIIVEDAPDTIIYNDKITINDILLFSNHIPTLFHYFSCIATALKKYRMSFKLGKCDLFKSRVKFDGNDLTAGGNCSAQSKFNLIKEWP